MDKKLLYYVGLYSNIRVMLGLYGIMDNKMEAILCRVV